MIAFICFVVIFIFNLLLFIILFWRSAIPNMVWIQRKYHVLCINCECRKCKICAKSNENKKRNLFKDKSRKFEIVNHMLKTENLGFFLSLCLCVRLAILWNKKKQQNNNISIVSPKPRLFDKTKCIYSIYQSAYQSATKAYYCFLSSYSFWNVLRAVLKLNAICSDSMKIFWFMEYDIEHSATTRRRIALMQKISWLSRTKKNCYLFDWVSKTRLKKVVFLKK